MRRAGWLQVDADLVRHALELPATVTIRGAEMDGAFAVRLLLEGDGLPEVREGDAAPEVTAVLHHQATTWEFAPLPPPPAPA